MKERRSSSQQQSRLSGMSSQELGSLLQQRAVDVYVVDGEDVISRWLMASPQPGSSLDFESSPTSCLDCMIVTHGNQKLIRFQFNINGQIVDWRESEGVRTGILSEEEPNREKSREWGRLSDEDSERCVIEKIVFDRRLNTEVIRLAKEIVCEISEMSIDCRSLVLNVFDKALSSSPNENKSEFENSRVKNSSERRPSFWSNVRRWAIG